MRAGARGSVALLLRLNVGRTGIQRGVKATQILEIVRLIHRDLGPKWPAESYSISRSRPIENGTNSAQLE